MKIAVIGATGAVGREILADLDLGLETRLNQPVSLLSGGQRQSITLIMATLALPKLLLLDEPTSGLNDQETDRFRDRLFKIRDMGITILVIEHHMKFIMNVCDEIVVLNFGVKIAEGSPVEIQNSPQVIEAYLGAEEEID